MVDTLKDIGPGDIVALAHTQFKVYKVDTKAKRRTFYKIRYADSGQVTINDFRPRHYAHIVLARFVAETIGMKTVPTTFKGHATAKDCNYRGLALFVRGDQEVYQEWLASHSGGVHDARDIILASDPDKPTAQVDTKRFKKIDLICAVLAAHGPLHKDDVLRRVAILEGKPWVKGSNSDYFTIQSQHFGCIKQFGKDGAKVLHYLTEAGVIRGSQVLAEVGMDLVKGVT